MMIIGILPTIDGAAPQRRARCQRQPALRAAQRADLRRPRGGPRDRHPRRRAAVDLRRHDRARGGVHERPAAPAGRARRVRRALERRAGDRRRPGRRRRQLAVLLRQGAVARDAHRALRAGHRHAPDELKAQGVRPRVWFGERWITSIFDLFEENVRYFPALLPVCEDEDPVETLDARRHPRAAPSCACTTGRSTAGTGRSTTSCAGARTCASRTASCPPGPTVVDILANAAFYYGLVQRAGRGGPAAVDADVVLGGRGELPRRRARRHRRARLLARAWARCRSPSSCCAGCCPLAHEGLDRLRRRRRRARPPARHHRAPLRDAAQRRLLAGRRRSTASTTTAASTATRRCAR